MADFLSWSHEAHSVNISIVLVSRVSLISNDSLDKVIESIFVKVVCRSSQKCMDPVGVVSTISVLIVLNCPQSVSQILSIQSWVQSISMASQWGQGLSCTSKLLTSEVFVELTVSESLISTIGLVLTSLKLVSKFLKV